MITQDEIDNRVRQILSMFSKFGVNDPQMLIDDAYLSDEVKLEIELYGKTPIETTGREVKLINESK